MDEGGAWVAFRARLKRQIDGEVLEAFRRAGATVYDLADDADDRRRLLCLAGRSPWQFPLQFQTELLCIWIAFGFQVSGDRLLLEEYTADPGTAGYLPPETHGLASEFYAQVNPWLVAARMAKASQRFRVHERVPVDIAPWAGAPPRQVHLRAMAHIADLLSARLAPVLECYGSPTKQPHERTYDEMRRLYAEADATADYADDLLQRLPEQLERAAHENLFRSLQRLFVLGQYAAFPGLLRDRVL